MPRQIINLQAPLNSDLVIDLVDVPSFIGGQAAILQGNLTVVTTQVISQGGGDVKVTFPWSTLQVLDPGAASWDCVVRKSGGSTDRVASGTVAVVAGIAPPPPED
jgi:hypothetical protein